MHGKKLMSAHVSLFHKLYYLVALQIVMPNRLGPINLVPPCISSGMSSTRQPISICTATTYAVQSVKLLAFGPPEVEMVNGYINLSGSFPSLLISISRSLMHDVRDPI